MWILLAVVAAIALVVFWRGPNAVWGGAVLGTAAGFAYRLFIQQGAMWSGIVHGAIVGILVGLLTEILGRLASRAKAGTEP